MDRGGRLSRPRRPGAGVAAREQAWNARQLLDPPQRPLWRTWRYRAPAVVLGAGQAALHDAARATAEARDIALLRRRAGGGAVLVGPWLLGVSVVLPAADPRVRDGALAAYRWLGEALAEALSFAGVRCRSVAPREGAARGAATRDWACFGAMAPWEVACGRRKIAGLAQVRTRHAVLLVGGVLLRRPDWELLCLALAQPAREARRLAAATCDWSSAAPHATPDDVERVRARLREALSRRLRDAPG